MLYRQPYIVGVICISIMGLSFPSSAQNTGLLLDPDNFIVGADMSGIGARLAGGFRRELTADTNNNEEIWTETIREGGLNYVRLRIFHNPTVSNGHERAYSPQGYCDLPHTIEIAKQIKAAGLGFLLDFHYSDTWADPGKQWKPVAWNDLEGAALEKALYDYTKDVLEQLKAANAPPDMMQVGNEVINGMLWPDGQIEEYGDWTVFCNLLKAGVRAVRDVDPKIKIMLHLALGGENHRSRNFLDKVAAQGVDYDIIGQSYYSQWHGTLSDLRLNLFDLAERYDKPIMLVEYGAGDTDVRVLHDIVRALPESRGIGTCIFGGEYLAGPQFGWRRSGGRQNTDPLDIYRQIAQDYAANNPIELGELGIRKAPPVSEYKPLAGVDLRMLEFERFGTMASLPEKGYNFARIGVLFSPERGSFGSRENALKLAQEAKQLGLPLMLVIHYSDEWANRDQQNPPAAWQPRLSEDLESTLFQYTRETVALFEAQGTPPTFVQIGNEVSNGFLLPKGKADIEGPFGGLIRVGSAGARVASPETIIMVSLATASSAEASLDFLHTVIEQDMVFDAICMSYSAERDGKVENLQSTLSAITAKYEIPLAVATDNVALLEEIRKILEALPNGCGLGTILVAP